MKAVVRLLQAVAALIAAMLLLEGALAIYNPFQTRLRRNRIVLLANERVQIKNHVIPALDPLITVTRNSLGFRGPNPPPDLANRLSIVTVGGSTTLCFFLSDDKTWTAKLGGRLNETMHGVWVNNAGLDGQSTYAHVVLLEDDLVPLHPKVLLFLVGAGDVAREPNEELDTENMRSAINFGSPRALLKSLAPYSALASLAGGVYRRMHHFQEGLIEQHIDLRQLRYLDVPDADVQEYFARNASANYLAGYESRLRRLIDVSRANSIDPVLVTHPLLAGEGIDDVTGVDLARIETSPGHSGRMYWELLEKYNAVTRRVGQEEGVLVIDLARELPKSSRYFYDFIHYTDAGADKIAEILSGSLVVELKRRFPNE